MYKFVLTDTCFWIGLFTPDDQYHSVASDISDLLENTNVIVPWPCLIEAVSTHLVRNRERLLRFEEMIRHPRVQLLEDDKYRDAALTTVFENSRNRGYSFALSDAIIREILNDKNIRIDCLVTFNSKDFNDLCQIRNIEVIDG